MSQKQKFSLLCLKLLGVVYLIAGLIFIFLTNHLIQIINLLVSCFPEGWGFIAIPQVEDKFWLILVFSMMMMLVFSCYQMACRPFDKSWHRLHQLSKGISSLGFLVGFFVHFHSVAYLVGFLTDFPLWVLACYLSAQFPEKRELYARG